MYLVRPLHVLLHFARSFFFPPRQACSRDLFGAENSMLTRESSANARGSATLRDNEPQKCVTLYVNIYVQAFLPEKTVVPFARLFVQFYKHPCLTIILLFSTFGLPIGCKSTTQKRLNSTNSWIGVTVEDSWNFFLRCWWEIRSASM